MKISKVDQTSEEWQDLRKGKITGTKLKGLVDAKGRRKIGFYHLLAEKIATEKSDENPASRGIRLEEEAIGVFEEKTKKKVERVGFCMREDNEDIALSPDGLIEIEGKYSEAIEIKCLNSGTHLKAYFENLIPDDYSFQILQYFIVNDDLETLYFVLYDPRVPSLEMHIIPVQREDLEEQIEEYRAHQELVLKQIDTMAADLAF